MDMQAQNTNMEMQAQNTNMEMTKDTAIPAAEYPQLGKYIASYGSSSK